MLVWLCNRHHKWYPDFDLLSDEDKDQIENAKIAGIVFLTIITGGVMYEAYVSGELAPVSASL